MQQFGAAGHRDREQSRVEDEQEAEEQRRVLGIGSHRRQVEGEQHGQGGRHGGRIPERRIAVRGGTLGPRREEGDEPGHREHEEDADRERQPIPGEELHDPGPLIEGREDQAQNREDGPALPVADPGEADVDEQQVAEQAERPVLARGEQRRGGEAADQTEQGDEERVAADRQQHGHHRHEHEEQEGPATADQVPEGVRGKEGGEEDRDAGAVERVGGDLVATCGLELAEDEETQAGDDADGHPDGWLQPAALDRVAEEEDRRKGERDAGNPREELHADQALPVERRPLFLGRRGRRRRRWRAGGRVREGRTPSRVGCRRGSDARPAPPRAGSLVAGLGASSGRGAGAGRTFASGWGCAAGFVPGWGTAAAGAGAAEGFSCFRRSSRRARCSWASPTRPASSWYNRFEFREALPRAGRQDQGDDDEDEDEEFKHGILERLA